MYDTNNPNKSKQIIFMKNINRMYYRLIVWNDPAVNSVISTWKTFEWFYLLGFAINYLL